MLKFRQQVPKAQYRNAKYLPVTGTGIEQNLEDLIVDYHRNFSTQQKPTSERTSNYNMVWLIIAFVRIYNGYKHVKLQ